MAFWKIKSKGRKGKKCVNDEKEREKKKQRKTKANKKMIHVHDRNSTTNKSVHYHITLSMLQNM